MRSAEIYYKDRLAGILTETDEGEYKFEYTKEYSEKYPEDFITFTMPVKKEESITMDVEGPVYIDKRLFPFFEGLIPEGWLLDIATKNWKLNPNDRMGLLLACCQNCIGAVSVKPIVTNNE